MRAGMVVSTATTITVPVTTAIGHQVGGWLALPSWLATVNRPNPAGDAEQGAHKGAGGEPPGGGVPGVRRAGRGAGR
jgi:hypothetical protein